LVLTNGVMSGYKRALAQVRLFNWAKAKILKFCFRWLKPTAMNVLKDSCELKTQDCRLNTTYSRASLKIPVLFLC